MHRCISILVVSAFVLLVACERAAPPEVLGSIYFGSGNYLAQLNLRNGSIDIVANLGDLEIREISAKDDRYLLLNVFGPVNQMDSHRLVLFDLETRQQLTLVEGRYGRYLNDGQTLVYDDGSRIRATWKTADDWEKVEVAQHPFNAKVWIVPVTDTAFLYSTGPDKNALLRVFDTVDTRSAELEMLADICMLDGAIWIEARSELLCLSDSAGAENPVYVFVGLDGVVSDALDLPPDRSFRAVAYMPDRNAVVLTEPWRSWMSDRQKWAVWIYDVDSAKAFRLFEHQHLGRSVIYRPDQVGQVSATR